MIIRLSQPHPIHTPAIGVTATPLHIERGCRVFVLKNSGRGEVENAGMNSFVLYMQIVNKI